MTKKNLLDLAVVATTYVENEPTQVTCQQRGTDDMLQLMDQKRETDDTAMTEEKTVELAVVSPGVFVSIMFKTLEKIAQTDPKYADVFHLENYAAFQNILNDLANVVPMLAKFYTQASESYEQACTRHISIIIYYAGNIGILQGAERFDYTRGYKFSTYVLYWIRKAMSQLVSRHGRGIKVPMTLTTARFTTFLL